MEREKNIMILQEIKRLTYLVQSNLIREEVLEKNDITQVQSLEDVLDKKQEETLFNCCELIKLFPLIDDPYTGLERAMGRIDLEAFKSLCLLNKPADETEEEASVKAAAEHERWVNEISMMVFQYAEPEEPEASPLKPYYGKDLDDLKSKYGLEVYRMVRKGFREARVAMRTQVYNKPWNGPASREATLSELISRLPQVILPPRRPRREG